MITGSFIMISEGEIKERRKKRETELRKMVYEEYENFKIYISFYELPEIKKITFMNMRGCDAAVSPIFSSELEIRINEKYLKAKCPMEYLKVILFHEFTHIWDRIVKYADLRAAKLTEYHAVQVAFAKNLNQKRIDKWDKFSENQFVSYNDKRVSAKEYLQVWCDHYSYDMEYHYYNESDDRTNQFMYDLCQWMGYSIIFEKYCIEWNGTRKIKGFIPKDMEDLIEQFYISLRDDFGKEQIVSNYNQIKNKFNELNHIQFIGNENYFLIERTNGISAEKSFKEHCIAIEKIYNDMKKKHSPQFLTNQPYLNKSFVLQYFRKMYQDMLSVIDTPFLFKKYMEHYSLICLDDITKMKSFLESEIRPIFESKSYFEIVIKKIELLNEVEICTAPNGKSYYRIFNVQNFIESIGFTPAFLAALLMGIADAGYEIKFSNVMIISKVV